MAKYHFACQDGMCAEPVGPNRVGNRGAQRGAPFELRQMGECIKSHPLLKVVAGLRREQHRSSWEQRRAT